MKTKTLAFVALVLILAAGLAWWLVPKDSEAPNLQTVRVAQTGDFLLYAGLYVAKDAGIFERNGLSVEIISTGGDERSAAAVISGQAQFGIGDPVFAAIANVRGQQLRYVASLVNGVPFWGITYDPRVVQRYRRSGLQGLRVATFPAPSTAFALQRQMYERASLPANIQEGAFGSLDGILQTGRADIALELEPNVSLAQQRGATVLYSMAEQIGPFAMTGVLVEESYARAHPSTVRAFCGSLLEAFRFLREQPAQAETLLARRFGDVPRAVVRSALARSLQQGIIPETAAPNGAGWDRALQLRASIGDLPSPTAGRAALDSSYCVASPRSQ